ncbi:hypothetical protein BpHYR1_030015 [Brachionus plicatilis]|uniref:Uncharacterized protein n=1 Tax=Brachionus plicatilis TaxID=10195 RepID=A0A3M7QUG7_BRAPC|nr:hypothetical protein BpHYR1_030015 [Brachionus plicatilis]
MSKNTKDITLENFFDFKSTDEFGINAVESYLTRNLECLEKNAFGKISFLINSNYKLIAFVFHIMIAKKRRLSKEHQTVKSSTINKAVKDSRSKRENIINLIQDVRENRVKLAKA